MGVSGDKQLIAKLYAMSNAVTPSVRKSARQKALKPVEQSARAKLIVSGNVKTRALVSGLTTDEGHVQNMSVVAVKRGRRGKMNRNPARYQHLVEFGTAPHWQPNRFGGIMHPGARPFPHMRPAFEEHRDNMVKIYYGEVWTAIAKAAK